MYNMHQLMDYVLSFQLNLVYYILRNSWGTSWGSNGYMYLGRGNDPLSGNPYNNGGGQCGVLSEGSYPIIN